MTTTTSKPTIELIVPAGSFDGDFFVLKSAIKIVLEEMQLSGVIGLEKLSDAARNLKLQSALLRDVAEATEQWADLTEMKRIMERREGVVSET